MKRLVVDPSVIQSILHNSNVCRTCLDEINKSRAYCVVWCSGWIQAWNDIRAITCSPSFGSEITIIQNFLDEWKHDMLSTARLQEEDFEQAARILDANLQSACPSKDCVPKGHNAKSLHCYRLILASKSDGIIVYCATHSVPCPSQLVDDACKQKITWEPTSQILAEKIRCKTL